MLFRNDILQGIAEGRVTLAFRRWRRARTSVTIRGNITGAVGKLRRGGYVFITHGLATIHRGTFTSTEMES